MPGHPARRDLGDPADLADVAHQRGAGAGVLDLHRDVAAVLPDGPVHLPDRGRGHGVVVERLELAAPPRAEVGAQHAVHRGGRHRRGAVLQLGQHGPVVHGEVLGQGRLEDRERLPELHRAALELPEDLEELLGGAGLQLRGHDLGGPAPEPLAEAEGGATGEAERHRGELGRAHDGLAWQVGHGAPPRAVRRSRAGASGRSGAGDDDNIARRRVGAPPSTLCVPARAGAPDHLSSLRRVRRGRRRPSAVGHAPRRSARVRRPPAHARACAAAGVRRRRRQGAPGRAGGSASAGGPSAATARLTSTETPGRGRVALEDARHEERHAADDEVRQPGRERVVQALGRPGQREGPAGRRLAHHASATPSSRSARCRSRHHRQGAPGEPSTRGPTTVRGPAGATGRCGTPCRSHRSPRRGSTTGDPTRTTRSGRGSQRCGDRPVDGGAAVHDRRAGLRQRLGDVGGDVAAAVDDDASAVARQRHPEPTRTARSGRSVSTPRSVVELEQRPPPGGGDAGLGRHPVGRGEGQGAVEAGEQVGLGVADRP